MRNEIEYVEVVECMYVGVVECMYVEGVNGVVQGLLMTQAPPLIRGSTLREEGERTWPVQGIVVQQQRFQVWKLKRACQETCEGVCL